MDYMPKPSKKTNTRALGTYYEQVAAQYVKQQGYTLLETNFRCRLGEIDLIALDQAYIIFIEVKYRKSTAYGYPREAVTYIKKQHIYHTAQYYLLTHYEAKEMPCRFDVIEILNNQVTHLKGAF